MGVFGEGAGDVRKLTQAMGFNQQAKQARDSSRCIAERIHAFGSAVVDCTKILDRSFVDIYEEIHRQHPFRESSELQNERLTSAIDSLQALRDKALQRQLDGGGNKSARSSEG